MKPVHPGEILREELAVTGLSANAFASKLCVPTNRITAILNHKRSISADTATRLARFFSTTPEFWLNLQRDYDLKCVYNSVGKKIERDIDPYEDAA